MGRVELSTDTDELGYVIHQRNEICSRNFLDALQANHGLRPCEAEESEPVRGPAIELQDIVPMILAGTNRIELIKRSVCKHFGVSRAAFESSSRRAGIVRARQIAAYLASKHTKHSLKEIGRRLGGRDHSTILHAFHKISALLDSDESIAADVSRLEAEIL